MIHVTRLNHASVVLNSDLIEQVERTPDTVITLTNGNRIVVLESPEELVQRVVAYRRLISGNAGGARHPESDPAPGKASNAV